MCHCEEGWKGAECDIPLGDCQVPDCNQHGQCVRGSCVCNPGWKGAFCDERKLTIEEQSNETYLGKNLINTSRVIEKCRSELFAFKLNLYFLALHGKGKGSKILRNSDWKKLSECDSRAMSLHCKCARRHDTYFSLKNGLAEVTGDGKRLPRTSISAPGIVISSCLSQHH